MKTFFYYLSNQGVNFHVIWHDLSPLLVFMCVGLVFVTIWAAKNWKCSCYGEYKAQYNKLQEEYDKLKCNYNSSVISNLLLEDDIKDLNKQIEVLSSKIQKRNPDGTFAKTSGKGHCRKK